MINPCLIDLHVISLVAQAPHLGLRGLTLPVPAPGGLNLHRGQVAHLRDQRDEMQVD